MRRQKTWRVRVKRSIEDWVDVPADNPLQAEALAANLPNVIVVFAQSAILGTKPVSQSTPASIADDEEEYG